jgi:hypothetical protein
VTGVLDDSLDFDAVMRLPLNFDDPAENSVDPSFAPFRSSSRKFDDDIPPGAIDGSKRTGSSSGFYSDNSGYGDLSSAYAGQAAQDFSRLGSNGFLPPNPPDRFGSPGLRSVYGTENPGEVGGFNGERNGGVGFGSSSKSFDSMPYGVGLDAGLGPGLLGGHNLGTQPGYGPPGYPGSNGMPFSLDSGSTLPDLANSGIPASAFPSLSWLNSHGMGMYRWSLDSPEIAMFIRSDLVVPLLGNDGAQLNEFVHRSNCSIKHERRHLFGSRENFLLFQGTGPALESALQLIDERLKYIIRMSAPPSSMNSSGPSAGLPSSSRLNLAK